MSNPSTDLSVTGKIFNIQRYCTHDGPGIRTTVFLKGCPLRCAWCHNPESHDFSAEIEYAETRCLHCGACVSVCPAHCHKIANGRHVFDRSGCIRCGACVRICPSALSAVGREVTAEEVIEEVMEDAPFYKADGGVTLSGGEPLSQPVFARALLSGAKERGITTCIETSGCVPYSVLKTFLPVTDLFLYDYKLTDPELHKKYVGTDNLPILENLFRIDAAGAKTVLRCPIIPGVNDTPEHFDGIARAADALSHLVRVEIEPAHSIGEGKNAGMGYGKPTFRCRTPSDAETAAWIEEIGKRTKVGVGKS